MSTRARRSRRAIAADIRECSAIWLRKAEALFGDPATVEAFDHAVTCAKRFEAALREIERPEHAGPSSAEPRQSPAARGAGA
jgi:hypothetical protein